MISARMTVRGNILNIECLHIVQGEASPRLVRDLCVFNYTQLKECQILDGTEGQAA